MEREETVAMSVMGASLELGAGESRLLPYQAALGCQSGLGLRHLGGLVDVTNQLCRATFCAKKEIGIQTVGACHLGRDSEIE